MGGKPRCDPAAQDRVKYFGMVNNLHRAGSSTISFKKTPEIHFIFILLAKSCPCVSFQSDEPPTQAKPLPNAQLEHSCQLHRAAYHILLHSRAEVNKVLEMEQESVSLVVAIK